MKKRLMILMVAILGIVSVYTIVRAADQSNYPLCWPIRWKYAWNGEPWYEDMYTYGSSSYQYQTVRALWSKEIICGNPFLTNYYNSQRMISYFRCYENATRLWYGQCLMEPYGIDDLTVRIPGTNKYLTSYRDRETWETYYVRWFVPYANKMAEKGLLPWNETFVDSDLRRDEAFSWAIRAAGLSSVAASMSETETEYWLKKFPDNWRIDPQYRKDVSLAAKLNIARGQPGDYLEPDKYLARVDGGAIVLRTASIQLSAPRALIVREETATIGVHHIGLGTPRSYTWRIVKYYYTGYSYAKTIVQKGSGTGLPSSFTWGGTDSNGDYVAQGEYFVELDVEYTVDGRTSTYSAVPQPIRVIAENRYLQLQPYSTGYIPDGGNVYYKPVYWQSAGSPRPTIEVKLGTNEYHPAQYCSTNWCMEPAPPNNQLLGGRAYLHHGEMPSDLQWKWFYDSTSVSVTKTEASLNLSASEFFAGQTVNIRVSPSSWTTGWGTYYTPVIRIRRLADNRIVRTFVGSSVNWDGKDSQGQYCDSGTYKIEGEITFRQYAPAGSDPEWKRTVTGDIAFVNWDIKNVQVTSITNAPPGNPQLPSGNFPLLVSPNSEAKVSCNTTGPAQNVEFVVNGTTYSGLPKSSRGSVNNTWTADNIPIGALPHETRIPITINSYDSSGVKRKTYGPVDFLVVDMRSVDAVSLAANTSTYYVSGAKAYVFAEVTGTVVDAPKLKALGQTVTMAPWNSGYLGSVNVPVNTTDGNYTATVECNLGLTGFPARLLTANTVLTVKQERLTLTRDVTQIAPRLPESVTVGISLRGVTTALDTTIKVKEPGTTTVYSRNAIGLLKSFTWDGKTASGVYCDEGGIFRIVVTVNAKCPQVHPSIPQDTISISKEVAVELPNVLEERSEVDKIRLTQ